MVLGMLFCGLALTLVSVQGVAPVLQGKRTGIQVGISYLSCQSVPVSLDSSRELVPFWFRPVAGAVMWLDPRGEACLFPARWCFCCLLGCQGHEESTN